MEQELLTLPEQLRIWQLGKSIFQNLKGEDVVIIQKKKLLIYSTGNLWLIHVKNVGVKQAIVERADHTAWK